MTDIFTRMEQAAKREKLLGVPASSFSRFGDSAYDRCPYCEHLFFRYPTERGYFHVVGVGGETKPCYIQFERENNV